MELKMVDVFAFYKFAAIENKAALKARMDEAVQHLAVTGTVLVADEGVNGTIAGDAKDLRFVLETLGAFGAIGDIPYKVSYVETMPFHRMKIRLKKEIVTIGDSSVRPDKLVGTYVDPEEWNDLIQQDDVFILDTRNDYEVEIGTFKGAVDPKTTTFREFPDYVQRNLDPQKHKKVAMFCTGGIRCEKASSYMLQHGFEEVYHLNGGILKYLECMDPEKSLWEGDCFVFDGRVSVKHGLELGDYEMCFGCRHPLTQEEMTSEYYIQGVCCPKCYSKTTDEKKMSAEERQKQIELAHKRQVEHLGPKAQVRSKVKNHQVKIV